MNWQCEHCKAHRTGEPAHKETVMGYHGETELWFCEDCTNI